jgi:hypothetical protein
MYWIIRLSSSCNLGTGGLEIISSTNPIIIEYVPITVRACLPDCCQTMNVSCGPNVLIISPRFVIQETLSITRK